MRQNIETAILGMYSAMARAAAAQAANGRADQGVEVLLRRANTSIRLPGL